jgi:hypothetical protein
VLAEPECTGAAFCADADEADGTAARHLLSSTSSCIRKAAQTTALCAAHFYMRRTFSHCEKPLGALGVCVKPTQLKSHILQQQQLIAIGQ